VIQTIDSVKLADEINKKAKKVVVVYIEVNVGAEETKSGIMIDEVKNLVLDISSMKNLRIEGLMTIEPYSDDPDKSRVYFRKMRSLFDEIRKLQTQNMDLKILSMGMSNSYIAAIEEGSNMVRIGSKIFGKRLK